MTATETELDPYATAQPDSVPSTGRVAPGEVPALVVVWSPYEPSRLGEVLLIDRRGEDLVFGRGEEAGRGRRLFLHRQRPGVLERTPAVQSAEISREPVIVQQTALGLTVRPGGNRALRVNGMDVRDYGMLRDGDTLEIDRQMLFLCTRRPLAMPSLRHGRVDMPFGAPDRHGMIGESPRAWKLRDELAYAAQMPGHVLVHGESGTGKELAATAIHRDGGRSSGMFLSCNAATFTSGLMNVELFGHARNFPNPGTPERPGLIGEADGGTLFLDEIGELPQDMHAQLLRVLDAGGEYKRLGEAQTRRSSFRLVAATNRDRTVLKHDFLAGLPIEIDLPSFRDRREDVPLLARAKLLDLATRSEAARQFVREVDGKLEPQMTASLVQRLVRLPYTTNAREIEKLLAHALKESPAGMLEPPPERASSSEARSNESTPATAPLGADQVRTALANANGTVAAAAKTLGITRQALYRLMDKYSIERK